VKANDHAIIYTSSDPPSPFDGEYLSKEPIKVISKSPRHKLESSSRLNYAKIYTVEHNVKVLFVRAIAPSSEGRLRADFDESWDRKTKIGAQVQLEQTLGKALTDSSFQDTGVGSNDTYPVTFKALDSME